ncbi:uncharacterized protein, partial [Chironomus tepperi]|uniref:uncharacterized protein n=1 Tax=Chironomus tepperi TaxID=113505 RepID=UPI00391EFCA9
INHTIISPDDSELKRNRKRTDDGWNNIRMYMIYYVIAITDKIHGNLKGTQKSKADKNKIKKSYSW